MEGNWVPIVLMGSERRWKLREGSLRFSGGGRGLVVKEAGEVRSAN